MYCFNYIMPCLTPSFFTASQSDLNIFNLSYSSISILQNQAVKLLAGIDWRHRHFSADAYK